MYGKNTFIATITGKNWWKDIVFIYILRNKLTETEQCNYDSIFEPVGLIQDGLIQDAISKQIILQNSTALP